MTAKKTGSQNSRTSKLKVQSDKVKQWATIGITLSAAGLISGAAYVYISINVHLSGTDTPTIPSQTISTDALFEKIEIGMTLSEVQSTLGAPGRLIEETSKTSTVVWYFGHPEELPVIGVFEDNLLSSKRRARPD